MYTYVCMYVYMYVYNVHSVSVRVCVHRPTTIKYHKNLHLIPRMIWTTLMEVDANTYLGT